MKWLLILLMCWVLPTAKIQEEEINMAIPSGYRAINEGDVGKQFGTHLDSTIYFDISIHDDVSTFPHVETTSNFEIVGHAGSVANYYSLIQDDDYNAPVASFYEYDIASEIGDWLSYESYNMGGYTITGVTEGSNAVVYVKPLNATFSVTFIENGGSNVDDVDGVTALPNPLPVPTRNGYTFAGWWNSDYSVQYTAGYTIYYNYTLYAKWTANLYDITYNPNGGSAVSSNIGVTAFPSPLPTSTKAGYTFAGWWNYNLTLQYSAGQTINGSLTAYAKWIANSYTVTYVANGGSPEPDPLTSQAVLPTPLPTINKSGYVSGGWYYNSLFTSQALAGDQLVDDVILYAKFTLATYTITYNLDGGTNSVSNPATYNIETATITLLNPSKAGYTFNGWFSDAELTTEVTEIVSGTTGNIVLYASFTLSETGYSVTYEENGGSPAQTDLTNQNYLPSVLPALTKTNYVFVGWYYDAEFTLPANPSDLLSANVTLYAKFLLVSTPLKGRLDVTLSDSTIVENSKRFPTGGAVYTGLIAKVDKVEGKSLVSDTEIAHLEALDTQAELNIKFGAKEDIANKGVANGYAPLNASGIVDPIYVPGAYTDYVEYDTYDNLPASGVEGTLYVVIADETSGGNTSTYRWTGSIYVNVTDKLSASEVKALYESNANTNAYTDDEKTKLSGIEPNAEVNILEGIKVEGESDLAITAKKSTIPLATDTISGALDKVDKAYIDNVRDGIQSIPYDNTTSGLDSTTLNGAIDEVEARVEIVETEVKDNTEKNSEQDLRIATIEEAYRKSQSGELTATKSGTDIISLGKDVAPAPLQVKVDGGLIPALENLVSGENIANLGTVTYSTVSGDKYYDTYTGTVTTGTGSDVTITNESGATIDITVIHLNAHFSVSTQTLIDNAVADIETMLALNGGYISSTPIHAVSMNKRVRSVGKNLFDGTYLVNTAIDGVLGTLITAQDARTSNPIPILPSTSYRIKTDDRTTVRFLDSSNQYISFVSGGNISAYTFTTPSNAKYMQVFYSRNGTNVSAIQFELGSTATTYVPYANTDLYLQANKLGYKLPNEVKDTIEFRNGKYYYVQRVKKHTLQSSDVTAIATGTNIQYATVQLSKLSGIKPQTNNIDNSITIDRFSQEVPTGTFDSSGNENKFTTGEISLLLIVAKGTYATLAQAQAALAGTVIYYQLATPIETEILALGNAQGLAGGTVYIDDIMADSNIYTHRYDIENTAYPIKSLDRIVKINADGSQTELAVSSATIAGDGLSFTHPSLVANDIVWVSYVPNVANTFKSNTFVTYYDNPFIAVQPNGTPRRITFSVDNSGVVTVSSEAV